MAREIRNYQLNQNSQNITNLLNQYLVNNGYENKVYNNEQVFCFTRIPGISGKLYFKFHISDYVLQIEGFIVAFGKEYGIDDNITAAMAKTDLRKEFENIEAYFQSYFSNTTNLDNNIVNNIQPQNIINNSSNIVKPGPVINNLPIDRKKEALTSFIISLVLIVLPLPFFLMVAVLICNIVTAIKGLKSSKKWMSILAIMISILELLVIVASFLLKIGGIA